MSPDSVKQSRDEAKAGIAAMERGRQDEAGLHFLCALNCLDDVQDLRERRHLLSEASEFFLDAGFEDLALMAVLDALDADKKSGPERSLIKDSITYANINTRLGNLERAEASYRSILERCLKKGDYANAASASTNLAGILADDNYLEEATRLLENSLDYLKKEEFRDTEINTRLMLIQVLEVQHCDCQRTFDEARTVLDLFSSELPQRHREVLGRSVEDALKRHLVNHPNIDAEQWKKQEFPELYGP